MIKGNEELYSVISRPLPLIPKKHYDDDKARSHQLLEELRQFDCKCEEPFEIASASTPELCETPSIPESTSPSIVYRRDRLCAMLSPNLLNLNKIIANVDDFSTEIRFKRIARPYYTPLKDDRTLIFESRFESGNLDSAIKISDTEYNLLLQNDINTMGNTQWFFFRVSNTTKSLSVRFNILNLGKGDSLYNSGMKILVFSESEEKLSKQGWVRAGDNISYYKNNLLKPSNKSYYSISFSYSFLHSKDTVYFAYSYPYTYTDLMRYLLSLENDQARCSFVGRRTLCNTISGNRCDCLTITGPEIPEYMQHRKGVFISARVHPGETVGSWIMHGAIEFLTGFSQEASYLREKFVFKVIPMLNPDGVINGNYRTNLSGSDLNRKWKNPSKILHPTIFHSKNLLKSFQKERDLELICDLHGHSRSFGAFMYGCTNFSFPHETRVFPLILSKVSESFDYGKCSFKMQKSKESTLRIAMFKELNVMNVFTLEASLCGAGEKHYGVKELMEIGRALCLGLMVYSGENTMYKEINISKDNVLSELNNKPELLEENGCIGFSDSDSEPSEDNIEEEILKNLLPVVKRRKKLSATTRKASKLSVIEKKSISVVRGTKNSIDSKNVKLFPIEKAAEIKRCSDCNETLKDNHICPKKNKTSISPTPGIKDKKFSKTMFGNNLMYYNKKGKPVRDQASQTVYIRKPAQVPEPNASFSTFSPIRSNDSSPLKFSQQFSDLRINFKSSDLPKPHVITSVISPSKRRYFLNL